MQNFTTIPSSETLTNSLSPLLNNDKTALSNSSGTVFPTTELQVGMKCWRTDQQKLYVLTGASPATWVLLADLSSGSTTVAAAVSATSASDSAALGGQLPGYYTDIPSRLGYTPLNKAGDTTTGQQYQVRATGAFNYWGLTAANYLSVGQGTTGDAYVKNAYPGKNLILGAGNTDHVVINSSGAIGAGGANFGVTGQVLTSAGNATPPSWQTLPQEFESGTRILFQQTAAPTGWTKDTTHNDKALRRVGAGLCKPAAGAAMSKHLIKLFMWGYQPHYRFSVEYLLKLTLQALGAEDAGGKCLLVGAKIPDAKVTHDVCIEPEDGQWPVALFANLPSAIDEQIKNHPLNNIFYGDEPSMRDKPENIRRDSVRKAVQDALRPYDAQASVRSFAGIFEVEFHDHYHWSLSCGEEVLLVSRCSLVNRPACPINSGFDFHWPYWHIMPIEFSRDPHAHTQCCTH